MNEKAQWQNRTGSFSNPRLQCPPHHPSTVCSRWAAGDAGRERKRERGEQGLHQGCSLDRANKSRPVTCSMAPFEEWGKFGQSEEKGRQSLFSLPKQLTARDRQERDDLKSQAAKPNEQDTTAKGAPAVVSLSLRAESDEEEEEEEGWSGGGVCVGEVVLRRAASSIKPPPPPPPPRSASLACCSCCSGDMAAGAGPDCRRISSMAGSGIAGKDSESRREKRARDGRWDSTHLHTYALF
ncbi:uncharacterized protein LOC133970204 [Platichthys flesus]|uniref:uncharacterized protein LOC133970204 n=1 Tax=Platichthys flesus TaxID=8260 RepID=UPI002DBB8DA2|nr:uncharacterized protein LOC133970204 [Platichthys flesus]